MNRIVIAAALATAGLICAGCESLAFQKWSPSARSMRDESRPGDVYWGANAEFAVLDERDVGKPMRPVAAVGGRDPLDVWNTPVPLEPTMPALSTTSTRSAESARLTGD